jgi:hypothetical protein
MNATTIIVRSIARRNVLNAGRRQGERIRKSLFGCERVALKSHLRVSYQKNKAIVICFR